MHSLQSSQVLLLASPDKVSSNRQPRGMDGQNGGGKSRVIYISLPHVSLKPSFLAAAATLALPLVISS